MSITLLRDRFAKASGLNTRHAAMSYVGNANILEFSGVDAEGKDFEIRSAPFYGNPHKLAQRLGILQRNKVLEKVEKAIMPVSGNLASTIRDRIEQARAKSAAAQSKIVSALDGHEAAVSAVEGAANEIEKEAAELQASISSMTNGAPK